VLTTIILRELNKHPWLAELKNGLHLIPTQFLFDISNPNSTKETDMGDGTGKVYPQRVVWDNIRNSGMRDPFYVLISLPNPNDAEGKATIRLESGNHRIKEALIDGITHLPVAVFIQSRPLYHKGNGTHTFDLDKNKVYDYYRSIGRDPKFFEPYPHPCNLKEILTELEIYHTKDIELLDEKAGIVEFKLK